MSWLEGRPDVTLRLVDIAPRWRRINVSVPKRLVGACLQGVRDALRVLVQLVTFRPHVIHLVNSGALASVRVLVLACMAIPFRVPVVQSMHFGTIPEQIQRNGPAWWLLLLAMRLAHKVVVIDPQTELALRGVLPAGKLVFLPNGIALGELDYTTACPAGGTRTVYFLGWVIPAKGIQELMEAWRMIGQSGWELIVAGPGEEVYRREVVEHAGPNASVRFLGELSQEKGWDWMRRADVFVLPSHTEGFPNVILEAMAAGKAIVATRVGAIPEMLDDKTAGPCGLLIDSRDPKSLAEALRRLMDDTPLRAELGRRAREKVQSHYDIRVVYPQYLEVWKAVRRRL
jgi:glycosyltransferase involved in cell wall biosynthesis